MVKSASIPPSSLFVTQIMINTRSNFCWEHSGRDMYLPILASQSVGWGYTLLVQFDLSKYSSKIINSNFRSYISLKTQCDSYNCSCPWNCLALNIIKSCEDLCSHNSFLLKDPSSISSLIEESGYTSQHMQNTPATIRIDTSDLFKFYPVVQTAANCDFRYFTIGITNTGSCNAWVHVVSWEIEGL
ncbi:hypothetical protein HWI79_515 [Cryptosporidium felis]|nr:hypothetical protein HWI79_515 [Cryptosporidium felis]